MKLHTKYGKMYRKSSLGNWGSGSQQSAEITLDRDATSPLQQYSSHEEHQRVSSPISLEQEGNTGTATMPMDTSTGSGVGTPDLVALLKYMQDQEAMRRREEEARRIVEKEHEAAMHKEWMNLEMKKLELEEKRLQQTATAEEA